MWQWKAQGLSPRQRQRQQRPPCEQQQEQRQQRQQQVCQSEPEPEQPVANSSVLASLAPERPGPPGSPWPRRRRWRRQHGLSW